jgi:cytochrome P450
MAVRVATEDITLRGCEIKANSSIAFLLGSANGDDRAWSDPDVVDFNRDPNRHIAFGRGIHRCLGSHLARLELRVALAEFHRRIPNYEIETGAELAWRGPAIRSLTNLPLRFPAEGIQAGGDRASVTRRMSGVSAPSAKAGSA